ncbi:clock interacting protein circadian [Rhodnius prolixus]
MAPTISELADRRRPTFSLEERLQSSLRLSSQNDTLRCGQSKRNPVSACHLDTATVCAVMGLVVEQELREGDSPALPSSNSHIVIREEQRSRRHSTCCASRKEDLIHLTLRTMALLKRNQMLQKRLTALQKETRAFVTSALKEQQQQHQQQQLATMMEHSVPRG